MPPLFERFDTDGDGRLSPWEIEWAAESLRALDRDDDGWIVPREFGHHRPVRQMPARPIASTRHPRFPSRERIPGDGRVKPTRNPGHGVEMP